MITTYPRKRYLIISDFDGTLFETSDPSPAGMTVQKAYVQSLDDIFGNGTGEWFFSLHPFRGEGPAQITKTLLSMTNGEFIENASQFYREMNGNFPTIIPESQDGKIEWHDEKPEKTLSSMLTIQKLRYLLKEIGTPDKDGNLWPLPCEGVLDFLKTFKLLRQENIPLDFAIVSSGHETFIKRALEAWSISQPDIMVTEDDVRARDFPQEAERKFKPGIFPLALAHFLWLKDQGLTFSRETGFSTRTRIMHIGDNPTKDLVMADNAGITSNFLYPSTSWKSITDALKTNKRLFDGRPIVEIIGGNRNGRETSVSISNPENGYHPGRIESR